MPRIVHRTAKPNHYNQESVHYDAFNEKNSIIINKTITAILRAYGVRRVADLACGTGSQVFWLNKHGFEVVGTDINQKMLTIAREKAKKKGLQVPLAKGDMRTIMAGLFDAVITIFNAIGHLTKNDFKKALANIHENLFPDGIYIFDINNLTYLLKDDHITKLTIDWLAKKGATSVRTVQYSTITLAGILTSYTYEYEQKGKGAQKLSKSVQTLQVYTVEQLRALLESHGFELLEAYSIDGSAFIPTESDRILVVARKR
jgi:2-polyprenyl-3-methyl-5-hydroxy-6-metoxy-1,4-benzoquinol methylase